MESKVPSISNIPSARRTTIGYRTVTNSHDQNVQQEELLGDVLDLFNKSNLIEKELSETLDVVSIENQYLLRKISSLESVVSNIVQKYKDEVTHSDIRTINIYPHDIGLTSDTSRANIDLRYSDITLTPVSSTSKVSLYDDITGTTFLPNSLDITVGPETLIDRPDVISITDNEFKNFLNGDDSSYWIRKVVTDNTVNEIISEVIITLPEDIITTRDINEIDISPYPSNALDIIGLEYRDGGTGSWTEVSNFTNHIGSCLDSYNDIFGNVIPYKCIPDAPNVKFNFNEINGNQLKITLRQKHYIDSAANTRLFCLGLKEVKVLNNKYSKDFDTFEFEFTFPNELKPIMFQGIETVYNNPNDIPNNTLYVEYYYVDNYNVPHKITNSLPFVITNKRILVKCKLYRSKVCPNINKIKIKYKLV